MKNENMEIYFDFTDEEKVKFSLSDNPLLILQNLCDIINEHNDKKRELHKLIGQPPCQN